MGLDTASNNQGPDTKAERESGPVLRADVGTIDENQLSTDGHTVTKRWTDSPVKSPATYVTISSRSEVLASSINPPFPLPRNHDFTQIYDVLTMADAEITDNNSPNTKSLGDIPTGAGPYAKGDATNLPSQSNRVPFTTAFQIQIGLIAYTDFVEALASSGNGHFTKRNISTAFLRLSNEERECLELPPHPVPTDIGATLRCKPSMRKIKLGNIRLGEILAMLDFENDFVSPEVLGSAFKAASSKERMFAERLGDLIVV
jgi:hypothetical protein